MQQITQDTLRDLGVVRGAGQRALLVDDDASFHDHQQGYAHRQLEQGSAAVHRQPQAEGDQEDRDKGQDQGEPVEGLHPFLDGSQVAGLDQGDLAEVARQGDSQGVGQFGHRLLGRVGAGDGGQGHGLAGQVGGQA